MAWGMVQVDERRIEFVRAAHRGEDSMTELCRQFEISRPTGYLWLSRFRQGGLSAIQERSRRPRSSPSRTPLEIEQRVLAARAKRPDWGARKLSAVLERDEQLRIKACTVHRILERHGAIAEQDRYQKAVRRYERSAPNQMWQIDHKSPTGWGTPAGPMTVIDDHSRYVITLKANGTTGAKAAQKGLIEAFERCGVPEEMLMDHGTPWWNMKSRAGWTWLTVWMVNQGIGLRFSGYRHPQTQGKVERFHGTLDRAMRRRGPVPVPVQEQQRWLDEFREEYNQQRPHEALGMKTPSQVWRPSVRAYQARVREWEYEPGAEVYRLCSEGKLQLPGRRWRISMALAGQWVKLERIGERQLVYYRTTLVGELDAAAQRSTMVDRWAW